MKTRRAARIASVIAAIAIAAVFAGAAYGSGPGGATRDSLACYQPPDDYYNELMMETAPYVHAADTTQYVDHQRIWLHITNWYLPYLSWGSLYRDTTVPDLWLYADATDNAWTNKWHLTSGATVNFTAYGVANVIADDWIRPGVTWETYRNDLYFPNSSGGYPSITSTFYPGVTSSTAGYGGVGFCA